MIVCPAILNGSLIDSPFIRLHASYPENGDITDALQANASHTTVGKPSEFYTFLADQL